LSNLGGFLRDLAPGEANDLMAEDRKPRIPRAVLLERGPSAMRNPAVDLDDEPFRTPQEVDLKPIDLDVDLRPGKAMATAEAEHRLLQIRARSVGFKPVIDRQPEELGLAKSRREFGWGKERPKVRQRTRGRGHRNPMVAGAVTGNESGGTVENDAGAIPHPTGLRGGDVNVSSLAARRWPAPAAPDTPQLGRAGVTEYGAFTAGKNGSHPPALIAESSMPHRINTTMKRVEPASLCALRDTSAR
jgi:hypothetical protein